MEKVQYVHLLLTHYMHKDIKLDLYISILKFTERIRINGENIPEEDVARIVTLMREKIEQMVKEGFSYPTGRNRNCCILLLLEQGVDYVALIGLGGRYDATNVIKTLLQV
ncbi:MAG: hypothetical protein ACLTK8_02325 [Paeniclostridium sp.]